VTVPEDMTDIVARWLARRENLTLSDIRTGAPGPQTLIDAEELLAAVRDVDPLVAIVERIMTQHWDMAACMCWVCEEGRVAGCRPREMYQGFKHEEQRREPVRVGSVWMLGPPREVKR
jgi:hypothetical protein